MGNLAVEQRAHDLLEDRGLVFDDDDDPTPTTSQPTDGWDRTDDARTIRLDDYGLPGYDAVVVITGDGEERICLACREYLDDPGHSYWPTDWRRLAPHELTGRLPKAFAPTCGRRTTSSGKPCKVGVAMYGDPCSRHAHLDSAAERADA